MLALKLIASGGTLGSSGAPKKKQKTYLWGQEPKAPKLCSEEKQRDMNIPDEAQYNYRPKLRDIPPKADVYACLGPKILSFRHLRPKLTCQLPSIAFPGFSNPLNYRVKSGFGVQGIHMCVYTYIYGQPMNHLGLLSCACSPTNGIIKTRGKTDICSIVCIFIVLLPNLLHAFLHLFGHLVFTRKTRKQK